MFERKKKKNCQAIQFTVCELLNYYHYTWTFNKEITLQFEKLF